MLLRIARQNLRIAQHGKCAHLLHILKFGNTISPIALSNLPLRDIRKALKAARVEEDTTVVRPVSDFGLFDLGGCITFR